jgi:hypothetical protein
MTDTLPKSRAAKAVDPNYCEFLGRICHSKACNFGCKELRGRPWRTTKAPESARTVALEASSVVETDEASAALSDPAETSEEIAPDAIREFATDAVEGGPPAVPAPVDTGKKQRRPRPRKALAPAPAIETGALSSGDNLSVLVAALAGLEHVDLIMSMAARILGVSQSGTTLEGMRETKRRLAALIAEVKAGPGEK